MDPARQVIRWSIPGWIFLFMAVLFQVITALIWGYTPGSLIASEMFKSISTAIAALIVAIGVPIGFIIYQCYYAIYGNILPFHFVNRDRGADLLNYLPSDVLKDLEHNTGCEPDIDEVMYKEVNFPLLGNPLRRLKREYRNRNGRRRYIRKQQVNWEIQHGAAHRHRA
ncbi:MAG TPA: hypothetical protein VGD58_27425 [Herpetosiphonaceae bacterium]